MNTEFEKVLEHQLAAIELGTGKVTEHIKAVLLEAHNQHLRTVLERLLAKREEPQGHDRSMVGVEAIRAEIRELENNHE